MITSITQDEHPFVLEADRTNPPEMQTVFYIVPKTVAGATESAANYVKAQIEKRRGSGKKEIDVRQMNSADQSEWLKAVRRITNYGVLPNCPGPTVDISSYDHFFMKVEKGDAGFTKDDKGMITVVDTTDQADLAAIMWSMSVADQEQIMDAYIDASALKETIKNG